MAETIKTAPAAAPAADPSGQPKPENTPDPQAALAAAEARTKELEAQNSKLAQENAETQRTLEFVRPFVNFGTAEEPATPTSRPIAGQEDVNGNFVSREEMARVQNSMASQLKASEFMRDNPDLKPYENYVAIELQRIKDPLLTIEQRLAKAGTAVREFVAAERKKGAEEATKAEVKADESQMAGLDGGSTPTPAATAEPSTEGQSASDYIAERRKQLSHVRGAV